MKSFNEQRDDLIKSISLSANTGGGDAALAAAKSQKLIVLWYDYLWCHRKSKGAEELLSGVRAAMLEVVAYLTVGLGRAALSAMRTEIDLLLSYTYFSEHPKEWQRLNESGDGFMLREAIYKYHEGNTRKFKERIGLLEQAYDLKLQAVYRIMSAHIHGQSSMTAPKANELSSLIVSDIFAKSVVKLQLQCSEALSNFLFSVYADQWPGLPEEIVKNVTSKMSPGQRCAFFGIQQK
jgi:hypothetical protein